MGVLLGARRYVTIGEKVGRVIVEGRMGDDKVLAGDVDGVKRLWVGRDQWWQRLWSR
jgi:hypothetical protein